MRIGKTPKKLDSICCPQCRETKADTLKKLRPIGEGDQELEKRLDQEELEREEAESMPPKVKSWRNTGDTPCRQGHQEEAKL
jgi:hypothetical protein